MSTTSNSKAHRSGNALAKRIGENGQILYKRKSRTSPLPIATHICNTESQAMALTIIWKRTDYLKGKEYDWIIRDGDSHYVKISGENMGTAIGKSKQHANRIMRDLESLGFVDSIQGENYEPKAYRCKLNLEDPSILYMDLNPVALDEDKIKIDIMELNGVDYEGNYFEDEPLNNFYNALQMDGCQVQFSTTNKVLEVNKTLDVAEYDRDNVYLLNGVKKGKKRRASNNDIIKKNMFYIDVDMRKDILYGSIPSISRELTDKLNDLLNSDQGPRETLKNIIGVDRDDSHIKNYIVPSDDDKIFVRRDHAIKDYMRDNMIANKNFLTREQMYETMDMILEQINEHPTFGQWHSVVSTGNGFHIYYIGEEISPTPENYSYTVGRYLDMFNKILEPYGLKCDKSCRNIGRLSRAPLSLNQSTRDLFGLEEAPVFIYEQKGALSDLVTDMEGYMIRFQEAEKITAQREKKIKKVSKAGDDEYDAIKSYPVENLVTMHTGMQLASNGKSFLSLRDGKPSSLFLNSDLNIVSSNGGSKYLQSGLESLGSLQYIMYEILGHTESNTEAYAETFKWARENILN